MPLHSAPRWFLRSPRDRTVQSFRADQTLTALLYPGVGATRLDNTVPTGYDLDHNRVLLGHGDAAFEAACAALRTWKMFPAPWTRIRPLNAPLQQGETIAMIAYALGLWWLNACRIVYVIDETAPVRRFGFAYGTLPAHVEEGEERFMVEQLTDGAVWYDLRAFSRPRYWPVRMAKPLARRLQKRFAVESKRAMGEAVGRSSERS